MNNIYTFGDKINIFLLNMFVLIIKIRIIKSAGPTHERNVIYGS